MIYHSCFQEGKVCDWLITVCLKHAARFDGWNNVWTELHLEAEPEGEDGRHSVILQHTVVAIFEAYFCEVLWADAAVLCRLEVVPSHRHHPFFTNIWTCQREPEGANGEANKYLNQERLAGTLNIKLGFVCLYTHYMKIPSFFFCRFFFNNTSSTWGLIKYLSFNITNDTI